MSLTFTVDKKSRLSLSQTLDLYQLSPARRKRVLKKVGQRVRRSSRDNLRTQRTIDGTPMQGRSTGRGKMLRRIGKTMTTHTSDKKVDVTWKNRITAQIAYRHQHGVPETFTASKMNRIYGRPDYNQPATRKQAKALLRAGFKLYAGKKRGKVKTRKPSQRWIMENMTMGHAGYLIRMLNDEKGKQSWLVNTPARPFLGVTDKEGTRLLAEEITAEWERQAN